MSITRPERGWNITRIPVHPGEMLPEGFMQRLGISIIRINSQTEPDLKGIPWPLMKTGLYGLIAAILSISVVLGQHKASDQIKVITVCEAFGDLTRFSDAAVAVVGRLERSVSLTDHYEFLSQDQCQHPVVTHGHIWPGKIQTADWLGRGNAEAAE